MQLATGSVVHGMTTALERMTTADHEAASWLGRGATAGKSRISRPAAGTRGRQVIAMRTPQWSAGDCLVAAFHTLLSCAL